MTDRVTFTIPANVWLTANRPAQNMAHRSRLVTYLHSIASLAARSQGLVPAVGRVAAHWTVRYPKGVRLDKGEASNAQPTTKALLDGLVKAGYLTDDGPKWVSAEHFERGPNLDRASDHEIHLTLTPEGIDR